MIAKLISIIILLLFCGCASVSFNPETGDLKYVRVGDQSISGFSMTKTAKGTYRVSFEQQDAQAEALTEAIKTIGVLANPIQ